jgi:hypothetical protein
MAIDHIRYDLLAREALRGVVRRVLADAAKNGLPGEHHFYVSFDTRAPGVRLSPRMRAQYPEEMTIVLQHQFWDLAVTDVALEVGLSFGGVPEKLVVPFDAIKGFFDPSVQFGLEFEPAEQAAAQEDPSGPEAEPSAQAPTAQDVKQLPQRSRRPAARQPSKPEADEAPPAAAPTPVAAEPPHEGGAEVVRLDRFRKK